jgi:HSP20 family molecular chaperone IbpA
MAENSEKSIEIQEQEVLAQGNERTRECRCFVPRADIYEVEDEIIIQLDAPGIESDTIDITLKKNVLTIKGYADLSTPDGYSLAHAEYEPGDYERSFRLSNEVEQENIEASYKNGVLEVILPKAEIAKARKINVLTE